MKLPFIQQTNSMDCGPTCLAMIALYHGHHFKQNQRSAKRSKYKRGSSLLEIQQAAESLGFRTKGLLLTFAQLEKNVSLPCIAHWDQRHFVVVYNIWPSKVLVADPTLKGLIKYPLHTFLRHWTGAVDKQRKGIALQIDSL